VKVQGSIGVLQLAAALGVKAEDVLLRLVGLGARGLQLNSALDVETAELVASEFGWSVENVAVSDTERLRRARPEGVVAAGVRRAPVVTVMGHVDHGKTTMLDRIRNADVAAHEAGGITQQIGAYVAHTEHGPITFIDTPGHAAFSALRARGARVTDLVVLVVAADDGIMPQTREAVAHARAAGVPIVVAINKLDAPGADALRVRRELSELGLTPEAWGGETLVAEVSARTGAGLEDLLAKIALQAEMLPLATPVEGPASGIVIEAQLDRGKGPLASVLMKEGTLRARDVIVVGDTWGKVRALLDDRGRNIDAAGPSTPVAVFGLKSVPHAGDAVYVVKDVASAQQLAERRHERERAALLSGGRRSASLSDVVLALGPHAPRRHLVVKADSQGSVEALRTLIAGLSSPAQQLEVVHAGIGALSESDVQLAAAASARLVAFRVETPARTRMLAQRLGVQIREHRLIYELADDVQRWLARLLEPELVEREIARAEVRQVFSAGTSRAAGCRVTDGLLQRAARARVERGGTVVWQGSIASLRRFRDDVREVRDGLDCGLTLQGFDAFEIGDVLHASLLEAAPGTQPHALAS
jgi:translation initiation factor IF-2